MNYIDLINQFWRIRRSKRITATQADLYYCLIQESNEREWENPFEFPNTLIIGRIGITEPTLIDARNRLKQLGLIDFENGEKKAKSPIYHILYLKNLSINLSKSRGKTEDNLKYKPRKTVNIITKPNVNEEEKEIDKEKSTRFFPPSLEEVEKYCSERGNSVNASNFVDFYQSKGWMVGKNKMKDWQATVRRWEISDKENKSRQKETIDESKNNFKHKFLSNYNNETR
jgi:hypothetical protein